jgi:hypothetical protein
MMAIAEDIDVRAVGITSRVTTLDFLASRLVRA